MKVRKRFRCRRAHPPPTLPAAPEEMSLFEWAHDQKVAGGELKDVYTAHERTTAHWLKVIRKAGAHARRARRTMTRCERRALVNWDY